MNKKIAIAGIVGLLAGGYWYYTVLSSEIALFERYPEIDDKIIIKAHRIMVRRALIGTYNDHPETDEEYEKIFLDIVKELQK